MDALLNKIRMAMPVSRRVLADQRNTVEGEIASLRKEVASLQEALVRQRLVFGGFFNPAVAEPPASLVPVDGDYSLNQCFRQLEEIAPVAFRHWHKLLEINATAYEGFPVDSCSMPGHPVSEKFRRFLGPYLSGNALDIGCGPQEVPNYLMGYPTSRIAGIDPLLPPKSHPFVFVQGTAEFLPWNNQTFNTVIAATSLDHILFLDRAMSEICRVLKKTGAFVVWVSFVPGAKVYDPYSADIQPLDRFHLFHFDYAWFLEMMAEKFTIEEFLNIDGASYFCSFRPLP
jgi:SAM-dependent methyltransferase